MRKTYFFLMAMFLPALASAQNGNGKDGYIVTEYQVFGDAMTEGGSLPTKKTRYFYGQDNRLVAVAQYGKDQVNDTYTMTTYTTNEFDAEGHMVRSYDRKYGLYYYGEFGFKDPENIYTYEYDSEGRIVKENGAVSKTYEYDSEGNLVKLSTEEVTQYNTLTQELSYSNFFAKDKPQLVVSTGSTSTYKYKLLYTYNEDGTVATMEKDSWKSATETYSEYEKTVYRYDTNARMTGETVYRYKNNAWTENKLVEHEWLSDTREKVSSRTWDSILQQFGTAKKADVYVYAEVNGQKYAPTLEVADVAGKVNGLTLTLSGPASVPAGSTITIYRDGAPLVGNVEYNGSYTYEQDSYWNGTYDYYVQLNDQNVSNVVRRSFNYDLPKATNLQEGSRRSTETTATDKDSDTGETITLKQISEFVIVTWDEPADKEQFGYQETNVMLEGQQIKENDEALTGPTYEVALRGRDEVRVYVQCIFKYGRSNSESLLLKAVATDVDQLPAPARTTGLVFSLDGKRVQGDFSSAPAGTYIVLSGNKAYKVTK